MMCAGLSVYCIPKQPEPDIVSDRNTFRTLDLVDIHESIDSAHDRGSQHIQSGPAMEVTAYAVLPINNSRFHHNVELSPIVESSFQNVQSHGFSGRRCLIRCPQIVPARAARNGCNANNIQPRVRCQE